MEYFGIGMLWALSLACTTLGFDRTLNITAGERVLVLVGALISLLIGGAWMVGCVMGGCS